MDLLPTRNNFSFQIHRDGDTIHSVHSLDFHPVYPETLATTGGDGMFNFFDKTKHKQLFASPHKHNLPITCGKFHPTGAVFAYAVSYDWSRVSIEPTTATSIVTRAKQLVDLF